MTNIFSLPTTYKQPQSKFSSKLFVSINSILALFPLCSQKYAQDKHTQIDISNTSTSTKYCSLVVILPCLKCAESQGHKADAHFKKQGTTKG